MNDDPQLTPEHPVERFKNMPPEQQEQEFSRLCDEVIIPVAKAHEVARRILVDRIKQAKLMDGVDAG